MKPVYRKTYKLLCHLLSYMGKRGIFGSKKADINSELYFIAFEVFLAIIVMYALFSYIDRNTGTDSSIFEKSYLSRDLALLTNTIYAAPGNVFYIYKADKLRLPRFDIGFSNQEVTISETGKDRLPFYYPYANDLFFSNPSLGLTKPSKIEFIKSGNDVKIGESVYLNLNKLNCPQIDTTDDNWKNKKLLIDEGHGSEELGFTSQGRYESRIIDSIAKSFQVESSSKGFGNIDHTRTGLIGENTPRLSKTKIKEKIKNSDIIISLHVGKDDKEINNLKAYYSIQSNREIQDKTIKLACLVLNKILDNEESGYITGASIIPIDSDTILETDTDPILNYEEAKDKIAILLELGNIEINRGDNMLYKEDGKIGSSMIEGLKAYYELPLAVPPPQKQKEQAAPEEKSPLYYSFIAITAFFMMSLLIFFPQLKRTGLKKEIKKLSRIKRSKKGIVTFNVLHFIIRLFFLIIVMVIVVMLVRMLIVSEVDIFEAESQLFVQRLLYSQNSISYFDNELGRAYPGIINLEKFKSSTISEVFAKANYYGEDNTQIAAKLKLSDKFGNEIAVADYNKLLFDRKMPIAKTFYPGPGGAKMQTRELNVLIKDKDKLEKGTLNVEVVIPNS